MKLPATLTSFLAIVLLVQSFTEGSVASEVSSATSPLLEEQSQHLRTRELDSVPVPIKFRGVGHKDDYDDYYVEEDDYYYYDGKGSSGESDKSSKSSKSDKGKGGDYEDDYYYDDDYYVKAGGGGGGGKSDKKRKQGTKKSGRLSWTDDGSVSFLFCQ